MSSEAQVIRGLHPKVIFMAFLIIIMNYENSIPLLDLCLQNVLAGRSYFKVLITILGVKFIIYSTIYIFVNINQQRC
jgi:hypothetical protein